MSVDNVHNFSDGIVYKGQSIKLQNTDEGVCFVVAIKLNTELVIAGIGTNQQDAIAKAKEKIDRYVKE